MIAPMIERTPLTLTLLPLEESVANTGGALPVEQTTLVLRNGRRLLKLVNTLLDFSRIEAGRVQANYEPTDLKPHGGAILVTSVPDRGTTFIITIPTGRAHLPHDRVLAEGSRVSTSVRADDCVEEALRWLPEHPDAVTAGTDREPVSDIFDQPADAARQTSAERRPQRILLADDNTDMRRYISRLLGQRYLVDTVADGEAALAAIEKARPDFVVTDVMMPKLDGFGLLKTLQADPRTRTIPVLLL